MALKFDLAALNRIDIRNVLEALGAQKASGGQNWHCFNVGNHNNNDNKPSVGIKASTNSCKCFVCGFEGQPVNVAKYYFANNGLVEKEAFKEACKWLCEKFGVATLDDSPTTQMRVKIHQARKKVEMRLLEFNPNRAFADIGELEGFIKLYNQMSDSQKLKIIYTSVYRFSLKTEQKKKINYYLTRGIKKPSLVEKIGFLSFADVKRLEFHLTNRFPLEDLVRFKVFSAKGSFNYSFNVCVVPNFDLYSNMVTGFSLRCIDYNPLQKTGVKELQVSCNDIEYALPYGLEYETLKNCRAVWISEGHIDCLSLKQYYKTTSDICFIAFSGVGGYKRELFGLIKDKPIITLTLDKDEAGIAGESRIVNELRALKAKDIRVGVWDMNLGVDINDLLKAEQMKALSFKRV